MMRRQWFFLTTVFLCCAFSVPEKTLIEVKYFPGEINYIHQNKVVRCAQNKKGGVVLGCARDQKNLNIKFNCAERHIRIDIYSTNREIEIHSDLPKDSCEYQEVLDHELTHMDLHADVLENIVHDGMEKIVDAFNKYFRNGKNCQGAINAANREFQKFADRYLQEDRRINYLFDRNDMDSVIQNCKTPPKVEFIYDPPPVTYVSSSRVQCPSRRQLCLPEKGKNDCTVSSLSCTDMAIDYRLEIKPYLASVKVYISVPEIKTRILNRYPKNSCEYAVLEDAELAFVDEVEDAIYHFIDTVPPYIADVYDDALLKEYPAQKLIDNTMLALKNYTTRLTREFYGILRSFQPVTPEELKRRCAR